MLQLKNNLDRDEEIRAEIFEMWTHNQHLDGTFECGDGSVKFSKVVMASWSSLLNNILDHQVEHVLLPQFRLSVVETVVKLLHGHKTCLKTDQHTFQQIIQLLQLFSINTRSLTEQLGNRGVKREIVDCDVEKRFKLEGRRHKKIFYTSKQFTDWSSSKNKSLITGENRQHSSSHVFLRVDYSKQESRVTENPQQNQEEIHKQNLCLVSDETRGNSPECLEVVRNPGLDFELKQDPLKVENNLGDESSSGNLIEANDETDILRGMVSDNIDDTTEQNLLAPALIDSDLLKVNSVLATSQMWFNMSSSTGKVEYECKICLVKSNQQEEVARHILLVHFNVLTLHCGVCDVQLTDSHEWDLHIKEFHGESTKEKEKDDIEDNNEVLGDNNDLEEAGDNLEMEEEDIVLRFGGTEELEVDQSLAEGDMISAFESIVEIKLSKQGIEQVFVKGAKYPLLKTNYSTLEKIYNSNFMSFDEAAGKVAHSFFRNNQTNKYECTVCQGAYKSDKMSVMQNHAFQHFNIYIIKCPYCFDVFRTKRGLETHMENHDIENNAKKEMIGRYHEPGPVKFLDPKEAKPVVESYFYTDPASKGSVRYKCRVCSKSMPGYHKIYNHCLGSHLRINCFKCDECGDKFKFSVDLTKHNKNEHDPKAFDYEQDVETDFPLVDDVSSVPMESLKKKKINHMQEKSLRGIHINYNLDLGHWECELCTLKSQYRATIQNHMYAAHYQVYIYRCCHCRDLFNNLNQLIVHRKTLHNKSKQKQTSILDTSIEYDKLSSPLFLGEAKGRMAARLFVIQDTSSKVHLCKLCDFKNSQSTQVMMHVLAKHLLQVYMYRCEDCGKEFRYNRTLFQEHKLTHTSQSKQPCTHCTDNPVKHKRQALYSKRTLAHHVKLYHTAGRHACTKCTGDGEQQLYFNTKHELMIHEAEFHDRRGENKMFECSICQYQFPTRSRLKKHAKRCEAGRSRILFRKQISDILVYLGKGSYKCAFCQQEFHPHPNDPLKAGLPEARNHVVSKHGMRHMRKLKMQWHGDPASVDKNVAYKDKSSIWSQKYKDMEKVNSATFASKTDSCLDDSYRALLDTLSAGQHDQSGKRAAEEGGVGEGGEVGAREIRERGEMQISEDMNNSVVFHIIDQEDNQAAKDDDIGEHGHILVPVHQIQDVDAGLRQVYAGNQSNANQIQSSGLLLAAKQDDGIVINKELVVSQQIIENINVQL